LNAFERAADGARERAARERLRETRRSLEHDVSAGDRRIQQRLEHAPLTDDRFRERIEQRSRF
jgi:hypothetical protein